ncbi:MAG: hypothetical protein M1308_18835 [Actinobacteria bacterium]|nr:hypothetical protein [Actinomycetota bacterium]
MYSDNSSPLSFFTPNEYFNIIADICDKDLESCFYFDANKEKVEQFVKSTHFNENIEYTKDTFGNLIQNAINLKSKNSKVDFEKFVKPEVSFFQELIPTGHLYNLNFYKNCKSKLIDSLTEYIEVFNKNHLSSDINFYDCKINLKKTLDILSKYYDKNGYRFNISGNEKTDLIKINFEPELRFYEVIVSLIFKGYAEIIDCNLFIEDKKRFLNIEFNLKNTPKEIDKIENSYISYGDLTVNKVNGFASYKKSQYYFGKRSRTFKILVKLINNPETKKNISTLYYSITKEQVDNELKKQRIKEHIKEINRKLRIVGDKKTINIRIVDEEFVMLTQN